MRRRIAFAVFSGRQYANRLAVYRASRLELYFFVLTWKWRISKPDSFPLVSTPPFFEYKLAT